MALVVPKSLDGKLSVGVAFQRASLWKIIRKDGLVLRFTDWPESVEFAEAPGVYQTFEPSGGADGSARETERGLEETSADLQGVIDSDKITVSDLKGGKFEGARIAEWDVDIAMAGIGAYYKKYVYFIRRLKITGDTWLAEMEGLSSFAGVLAGGIYGFDCPVELFSQGANKCNLSPGPYLYVGIVDSIISDRYEFNASNVDGAPSGGLTYVNGTVEWLTGNNVGLKFLIQEYDDLGSDDADITLQLRTQAAIQVGDTFRLLPGCNKQPGISEETGHCKNVFDNVINYQGHPTIPGRDVAKQGVNFKSF